MNQYKKYNTWYAEPKIDGQRCAMETRDGKTWLVREGGTVKNKQYPEVAANTIPEGTILDGELAIMENPFRANFVNMLQRETINNIRIKYLSEKIPATFVAFDVIKWKNKDVRDLPFFERKGILKQIIETPTLKVIQYDHVENMIPKIEAINMEGLVLKEMNGDYYSTWLKIKNYTESDFIVKGYTSESRLISALELTDINGNYVGKVNWTGPQTKQIAESIIGKTAVVRYMKTDSYLRFPVLKEIR